MWGTLASSVPSGHSVWDHTVEVGFEAGLHRNRVRIRRTAKGLPRADEERGRATAVAVSVLNAKESWVA